ncbi:MAG TPA: hypothetical protein VH539_10940 [Gemmatimonadaceae bacterium]
MGTTRRTRASGHAMAAIAAIVSVSLLSGSCGRSEARQREMYYFTKNYSFTITPSEAPPHAREDITYKVFIRDRDTREPIQNGEGQIYSNNREGAKTWDGFTYGPEVGTYYGKLNYVTSGLWAVGLRFRRDSLHPLEKIEWMQDVLNERSASPQ